MPKKIIIIGGVGTGTVIAATIEDIIQDSQEWEILGFLNDHMEIGQEVGGFPVLGKVDDAQRFNANDCYFLYAML